VNTLDGLILDMEEHIAHLEKIIRAAQVFVDPRTELYEEMVRLSSEKSTIRLVPRQTAMEGIDAAEHWLCECGVRAAASSEWRWNGSNWEHYHGYLVGHVETIYSPAQGTAKEGK
jgi:hypothetical protein